MLSLGTNGRLSVKILTLGEKSKLFLPRFIEIFVSFLYKLKKNAPPM